ncbi:MAG: hypothetical protein H0W42_03015 [Gemmatimonadaceae bacterium]|nr:hypothetical protein [Gemmatimonadaceae bacterium]
MPPTDNNSPQSEHEELLDAISKDSSPDELRRAAQVKETTPEHVTKYPGWRFHKTKPMRLVNSPDEEDALDGGYSDVPDADNLPGDEGQPSAEELRALANQTALLADQAAKAAGETDRNAVRRRAGEQANARTSEEKTEARKSSEDTARDEQRREDAAASADQTTSFASQRPGGVTAKTAKADKAAKADKPAAAKTAKASKAKTTTGKLGGRAKSK